LSSQQVQLRFREGAPTVFVRDLTGNDERCVRDTSTQSAVDLLARLVKWPAGSDAHTHELTAPDRDRLLAAIYQRAFGRKINSTATCTACSSPYDLGFVLDDLLAVLDHSAGSSSAQALPDGTFHTSSGLRFRLPTARDEMEVSLLPLEKAVRALASRCVVAPSAGDSLSELEDAIEEVAPVLDLNIDTACPECGARQEVRFDMQFYLLSAIERERAHVLREIHQIASAYRWSLREILGLERSDRGALVQLIEGDLAARGKGQ
jgi:hypothetical protein